MNESAEWHDMRLCSIRADWRWSAPSPPHGSFSAAADALSFSQPAVSKQIAALEAQAGTQLLERTPRGVTLTQAGELLVGHADAIAERLTAAQAQLEALADLRTGRPRLAAFPTAVATAVSEAMRGWGHTRLSVLSQSSNRRNLP
jgi:DNA-binding transcriptional LysR family regulator